VTQEDPDKVEYDAEKYQLKVFLLKQQEGEFFEDLDMLTKLLSKNKKKHTNSKKPLIELLESSEHPNAMEEEMP